MRAPAPASQGVPPTNYDTSQSYILMVQHLIERCLILDMDQDACVNALAKYAGVNAVITQTVWKELEKENQEFFSAYLEHRAKRRSQNFANVLEETTSRLFVQTLDSKPGEDEVSEDGSRSERRTRFTSSDEE